MKDVLLDKTLEPLITTTIDESYLSIKYIPSTQTNINYTVQKASNFDFNEFDNIGNVFKSAHEVISASRITTEEKIAIINYTQSAGDISENFATLMAMSSNNESGFFPSYIMSNYLQGLSIFANGLSIVDADIWLNSLINYGVPQGTEKAFDSSQKNIKSLYLLQSGVDEPRESKLYKPEVIASSNAYLKESQKDYFTILDEVTNDVKEGKTDAIMTKISELVLLDQQLMGAQLTAQGPIFSTANKAYDNIENFNKQYKLLGESLSDATAKRIVFYMQLTSYPAAASQLADSLIIQAEKVKSSISITENRIAETIDLVKDIAAPPFVLVKKQTTDSAIIKPGIPFELDATIQNVGALSADSVVVELETDSITSVLSKNKYIIPDLGVDESYYLSWKLQVNDTIQQLGNYMIKVTVTNGKGLSSNGFFSIKAERQQTAIETYFPKPAKDILYQNFPNPFKYFTTIKYYLPKKAKVILEVLDINGKQVKLLINKVQYSGEYNIKWYGTDKYGSNLPPGVYFCRLKTDSGMESKRMLIIKQE